MEESKVKVEVQGVPPVYGTTEQQPQDTPTPSQENPSGLDEFLTFDSKPNGVKKEEPEEMETETERTEVVETTEEENVDVVFEVNGQKINACMSASMAQMLKDSEEMRLQVIDKIMAEAGQNPDHPITVSTAEPSQRDTSTTKSVEPPTIKKEPASPTAGSRLNGQAMLEKRPMAAVVGNRNNTFTGQKIVTRGSVGIVKPKFAPMTSFRPAVVKRIGGPAAKPFLWDHKAIVALIECYKNVNERLTAMSASRNIDVWLIVGKRMRARGFQVTDLECERKFNMLTNSYKVKKKEPAATGKSWEYYKSMETALLDGSPAMKTTPKLARVNAKTIPVITVDDDSPVASDDEWDEDTADPAAKKQRLDLEPSAIDKFRRTYLRVETAKLKEIKAARALQQEQCKLQKERNEILNSIANFLSLKK